MTAPAATTARGRGAPGERDVGPYVDGQLALAGLYRRLSQQTAPEAVLRVAGDAARAHCGFDRAIVGVVRDDLVVAADGALADGGSEALRCRLRAAPVAVRAGSAEKEMTLAPDDVRRAAGRPSALAEALELRHDALGAVAPDGQVLAFLILDRGEVPVDDLALAAVAGLAFAAAAALQRVVTQGRLSEVAADLQFMLTSGRALIQEATRAPVALPVSHGRHGTAFRSETPGGSHHELSALEAVLSPRELQVLRLLADGRSTKQIAEQLFVSPETVRMHVKHVLRKTNAANRTEAVARYLRAAAPFRDV